MGASVKKEQASLRIESGKIAKSRPKRSIRVALQGLLSPIAKCENFGMRNILSIATSELYRWACITGLVAVAIGAISIAWLMRIASSIRSFLMAETPASVAEFPEVPRQKR